GGSIGSSALSAWMSPAPVLKSTGPAPVPSMSIAEFIMRLRRYGKLRPGRSCRRRAAVAAAAGAAAEVPKKFGKESASPFGPVVSLPKKLVLTPSGAVIAGVSRTSGDDRICPALSTQMLVGPPEEKLSTTGGLTPHSGVRRAAGAATASRPLA